MTMSMLEKYVTGREEVLGRGSRRGAAKRLLDLCKNREEAKVLLEELDK